MIWKSEYFCGNKVSAYGLENGYVDYATLAKSFDAVLNNEIMGKTYDIGEWEQENGWIDNSDEIDEIREEIENLEEQRDAAAEKLEELEEDAAEDLTEEEDARIASEMEETEKEINRLENEIQEKEDEIQRLEEEQDNDREVMQWYIVSDNGASILKDYTNEIVFYNADLDMYLWGVTHWGTSWDYVLTDIKIEIGEAQAHDI